MTYTKHTLVLLFTLLTVSFAKAQATHEWFQQEAALLTALQRYDMTPFVTTTQPVTFVTDTSSKEVNNAIELNALMRIHIPQPKNSVLRKASDANNGYTQTFGIYVKEDAVYYIVCNMNPLTGKLEEMIVSKNN